MPYNVTVDDISPIIRYTGEWVDSFNSTDPFTKQYLDESFHASHANGAQAWFDFNGTAVYIFGAKRNNHGNYTVQVDDEQPEEFSGFAPTQPDGIDSVYQVPIYVRNDLENKLHRVVLTNKGQSVAPYVDIDYVTWTSQDEAYTNITFDDGRFEYSPADAWGNTSGYVGDYYGRTEHLTNRGGASASLTFNGTGIYLYGGTLDDHGAFTVELNDHPPVVLNGSTKGYHYKVPLYFADGLGSGPHTLKVTNTDDGKFLDIDYVDIIQLPPVPTSTSASIPRSTLVSTPTSTPASSGKHNTPIIIGAVCGALAVLALVAAAAFFFIRRRKQHSEPVDLAGEEIKPYTYTPPAGYESTGNRPGWINIPTLQRDEPWTNTAAQTGAYTYSDATSRSASAGSTCPTILRQPHYSSSATLLPSTQTNVMAPSLNLKGRPPIVQATSARGGQTEIELRGARTQAPGRAQDWGELSDASDNKTAGMLPPDYRQATERFAPRT